MHHKKNLILYLEILNKEFRGHLQMSIQIFKNEYKSKFFFNLLIMN